MRPNDRMNGDIAEINGDIAVSSAKRGHFWRFHMSWCFVPRGRRGTS